MAAACARAVSAGVIGTILPTLYLWRDGAGSPPVLTSAAERSYDSNERLIQHRIRERIVAMAGSVLPIGLARRPTVTKDRILDAAEALFMEHGFEATSLRAITAAAGVNLAVGQLPLRQQGRAVPGGADAAARSDEPGAARPPDARSSANAGAGAAALRPHPVGDVRPRAAARARSRSAAARISCGCWDARTPIPRRSSASSWPSSTRR